MKTESSIDAVRLMRELREGIDRDVAPMTPAQRREYIRDAAQRVGRELGLPESTTPAATQRRLAR